MVIKPLPADHFNINNTNDNPKKLILLLTKYSGKQIEYSRKSVNVSILLQNQ